MDKAIMNNNQAGKVLKKGKKKQAKDELDRQKQAEKKRRRLEKALANSAAIISELEKKKQKKKEEQQRLDEEGAAIAEAVALHVLIGEDSDEPCHLMLNKHIRCNHWDPSAAFEFTVDAQPTDIYPSDDGLICTSHAYAPRPKVRWADWGIGQPLPSWGEVSDLQGPYYQGTFHQSVTCPGFVAAQAVSSLQIREESSEITSPSQGAAAATVVNRMLGGTNRLNLYREIDFGLWEVDRKKYGICSDTRICKAEGPEVGVGVGVRVLVAGVPERGHGELRHETQTRTLEDVVLKHDGT